MKNYMDITVTTCYILPNEYIIFFFFFVNKKTLHILETFSKHHVKRNGMGGHC
jgi:hypothetical protein